MEIYMVRYAKKYPKSFALCNRNGSFEWFFIKKTFWEFND